MGGKSGGKAKTPVGLTSSVQGVFIGQIKGYATVFNPEGADLSFDQFIETAWVEPETPTRNNQGHPLYKPFMIRRFGSYVGVPFQAPLAYDAASGRFAAFSQLQEGFRITATAKYTAIDEYATDTGDTLATEDPTLGVHRLWLVEGTEETEKGITFTLVDVLGG